MTLHRFFLPAEAFVGDCISFPPGVAHQITRVLRLRAGDLVIALDGSGREAIVRLSQDDGLTGKVVELWPNTAEPLTHLTLYIGLPKAQKLELVAQKCTEIGVAAIIPVRMSRSVRDDLSPAKLQRLETIAREAAEQSRRGRIPEISAPVSYADALTKASRSGPVIVLWEGEDAVPLDQVELKGDAISLFVGPEGGLAVEEVEQARQTGGAIVTLGPRILRTETAAMVGTALVLSRCDSGSSTEARRG